MKLIVDNGLANTGIDLKNDSGLEINTNAGKIKIEHTGRDAIWNAENKEEYRNHYRVTLLPDGNNTIITTKEVVVKIKLEEWLEEIQSDISIATKEIYRSSDTAPLNLEYYQGQKDMIEKFLRLFVSEELS